MTMIRKVFISILLATAALCSASFPAYAQEYQNAEVKVSKDKVRLNGKVCYIHVVMEHQTLFSIAKAYEVSIEDIYEYNQALDLPNRGLKAGQILYMPIKNEASSAKDSKKSDDRKDDDGNLWDKVKAAGKTAGEKISDAAESLKPEPKADKKQEVKEKEVNKEEKVAQKSDGKTAAAPSGSAGDYSFHVVKWYEDIDFIANKYNVSKESIRNINGMSSDEFEPKQMIKIPRNPAAWENMSSTGKEEPGAVKVETPASPVDEGAGMAGHEAVEEAPVSEVENVYSLGEADPDGLFDIFGKKKNVSITMLIPYTTRGSNTQMMDFYCGALTAARDLSKTGLSIDLEAGDVSDGVISASSERLQKSDFIIGPVSNADILKTVSMSEQKSWVVSPLDPKGEAIADSVINVIQAPVPAKVQIEDMARWIAEDRKAEDNVIVITQKSAPTAYGNDVVNAMNASGTAFSTLAFNVSEGRSIMTKLSGMLTATGSNRIVIASDNKPFVMEAMRNIFLVSSSKSADIQLYGTARLRSFEGSDGIDIEQMHSINTHISGGYFINYNDRAVKDFILRYRALFHTEPSQSAFQGYDLMTFFATMAHDYGRRWYVRSEGETFTGLQSDLNLKREGEGGFVNHGVRRVIYSPDFSIRLVR